MAKINENVSSTEHSTDQDTQQNPVKSLGERLSFVFHTGHMQNPCASQSELIKDLSDSLEPYCGTEEIALEFEQHFKAAEGPRQSNSSEQHDSKQYVRKYCSKDNNFPCLFKPFGDDIVANSDAHDIEEKEEIVDILKLVN